MTSRRRAGGPGTEVSLRVSGPVALVSFAVEQLRPGVRRGRRCLARAGGRPGPRCTRVVVLGAFARPGRQGTDRFGFTGRLAVRGTSPRAGPRAAPRTRALAPGRYRLRAQALSAQGTRSRAVRRSFRVRR